MPKNRRDSPHHCHASDLRTTTQLDPSIPHAHFWIVLQEVQNQLSQDESSDLAAFLGDRSEAVLGIARVTAAWGQPKVVRQAARSRKAFDGTDPAGQGETTVVAHAGSRHQKLCGAEDLTWFDFTGSFGNLFVQLGNLLVASLPFLKQHLHLQSIDFRQLEFCQPATASLRLKGLGGIVPDQIVAVDDPVDLIQGPRATLTQSLP